MEEPEFTWTEAHDRAQESGLSVSRVGVAATCPRTGETVWTRDSFVARYRHRGTVFVRSACSPLTAVAAVMRGVRDRVPAPPRDAGSETPRSDGGRNSDPGNAGRS